MRIDVRRTRLPLAASLAALVFGAAGAGLSAQDRTPPETAFLILKTGEPGAEPQKAGKFIDQWAAYLTARMGLEKTAPLRGLITNDPAQALELARTRKPAWGIVTPAFLFDHEQDLGLRALLLTRRNGKPCDRYSIVTARQGAAAPVRLETLGGDLATLLMAETDYVRRVVLPPRPAGAPELRLVPARNLADTVYALVEGEAGAPAGVLLDRAARDFFEKDELTWPKLAVAYESADLPPDLVVAFGGGAAAIDEPLTRALGAMLGDDEGKRICRNLQTEGFGPVDAAALDRVRAVYRKGAK